MKITKIDYIIVCLTHFNKERRMRCSNLQWKGEREKEKEKYHFFNEIFEIIQIFRREQSKVGTS